MTVKPEGVSYLLRMLSLPQDVEILAMAAQLGGHPMHVPWREMADQHQYFMVPEMADSVHSWEGVITGLNAEVKVIHRFISEKQMHRAHR